MRERYNAIYLSPHLDDAALSCGGQIFQQTAVGKAVLMVTLLAGEPGAGLPLSNFAQSLHQRWDLLRDAVAARLAEDADACRILGADALHWPVPDCIYRLDPATGDPRYPTWEAIISTQHPADTAVVAQLVGLLRRLPPAEHIYAPLTAGNHVDHRLTRQAAEQVFGPNLRYYEDYPYAAKPEAVTAVLTLSPNPWQATVIGLGEAAVQTKIEAIWAYASQRSSFFADRADAEAQIMAYTAAVGGERVWQLQGADAGATAVLP